jgi:tetratricopeptide (TPR) repeat protein
MKKITFLIVILFTGIMTAQTKYQDGMKKAFSLWENEETTKASQLFERISKAEPENWLPPYYAATIEIIESFGIKEEAVLKVKLTKAQEFLDLAKSNSENNPEIIITQALLNLGYIAFDGQKYGMTLSEKTSQLYAKALAIAPGNPRVILGNAEWNMGSARFFGKPTTPYCNEIKRAIELGKKEKIDQEFYPKFMIPRAEQVLKQCSN